MRLRTIKLSGFKSFVDPTTLTVPANLVGIVGPNGCGKSNIIDAVMWVMGESSAKHLRGDALTDVIFNGSSARNPVGQAAVELVFDNSDNKLGGQYASYNEISIKRQINRDAVSNYYLNGTRCRRRDITAIFLGTGLGPRSYAIIEQGMISRMIEAKPEELRTFIEEAAGISRYRERRRETENRIRHTKENIARLNDIREELDKQLKHLQHQAKAAERYQNLKKEQRQFDAELHALNWKVLKQQSEQELEETRKRENLVEAGMAELRQMESTIEKQRDVLSAANENFNSAQSDFYRIGGEISQLEQKIQHTRERIVTTEQDLEHARKEVQQVQEQQKQDEVKLAELITTSKNLEPQLRGSRSEGDKAYALLNQSEQAMQAWQSEWETFNETVAEYARHGEVGQTRLEHLELSLEDVEQRRKSLEQELETIDQDALQKIIAKHSNHVKEAGTELAKLNKGLDDKRKQLPVIRKATQQLNDKLNEGRLQHQKLEGRLASLEALQQSALGQDQDQIIKWLKDAGLSRQPRLAQQINVDPEWAHAVEIVLGQYLHDVCVDDITQLTRKLNQLERGQLGIVGSKTSVDVKAKGRFPSLADKIKGTFPLKHLLLEVYVADDLKFALDMRSDLKGMESVITRDGLWLGANWARVSRGKDEQAGMLSREQEMQKLKDELAVSKKNLKELEDKANQGQTELEQTEQQFNEILSKLHNEQEVLSQYRTELVTGQTQLEQAAARADRINDELDDLREQSMGNKNELVTVQDNLKRVTGNQKELENQRAELITLRDKHRESLFKVRERWQQTHEESHGIALQLESISSKRASLEQSIKRSQIQISHLQTRCADLNKTLTDNKSPVKDMQATLEGKLKEKVNAEKKLGDARTRVQQTETTLRDKEQLRTQQEHRIQELRDNLEKARLVTQESRVRLQTIEEQLRTLGHEVQQVLATIEEGAEISVWRERLERVHQKIQRLGPINLAAIDEFNQLSERKSYLDRQNADLNEALKTLENAIRKIDKESRSRFKDTFDQLNTNLQETFPQLFGGGKAYLELAGDDLLETGVTIMARPPGKRNSTIHLLSGGEKALTAVALVFAIFKLNPAPFCILDEVDAPLDDTNVGRFGELLTSMSNDVQFIFVTHNKITMEIAHQLLGVTMYEAGVSRLVTVDVDEAVKLAATA
ncbi:MAG: chromosome segregation protein [Gammaproteobacteria bacterium]|nr:chromosome segregation protein [Gammaproteobacteria bacterium]